MGNKVWENPGQIKTKQSRVQALDSVCTLQHHDGKIPVILLWRWIQMRPELQPKHGNHIKSRNPLLR